MIYKLKLKYNNTYNVINSFHLKIPSIKTEKLYTNNAQPFSADLFWFQKLHKNILQNTETLQPSTVAYIQTLQGDIGLAGEEQLQFIQGVLYKCRVSIPNA